MASQRRRRGQTLRAPWKRAPDRNLMAPWRAASVFRFPGPLQTEPESRRRWQAESLPLSQPQGEAPEPFTGHLVVAALDRIPRVEAFLEMAEEARSDLRRACRRKFSQAHLS